MYKSKRATWGKTFSALLSLILVVTGCRRIRRS